jgi:hypothetical protein
MSPSRETNRFTQRVDPIGEERAATVKKIGREKPTASADECATIIRHGFITPQGAIAKCIAPMADQAVWRITLR